MDSQALRGYLEQIIQEKAKVELEPDVKEQLVNDLYERLENKIYRNLVDSLNDSQLEELDQTDKSAEDMLKYIEDCGINTKDVITKTLVEFRASYIT